MSGRFPEPGKVFEEKYRVEKLLGSGGFARVYLAEQTDLGRKVAIKVLSPKVTRAAAEEQTDPKIEAVALRFEREARVVSQLRSAQTITMYDYGRTESGLLYMVMEYVDGTELDEISVPIDPKRVVKILKQMLQSLHEAHAHGLLHRDLKPANIMVYEHLGEKDQVKLLDFGIAKAVGEAAGDNEKDLTADNSLIGTPRYMSPEQIRGADIGPASDIYSLGLVAYELLMGEKAITNSDSIEILGRHLSSESFEIPRHHAIHPKLRRLINKMLAKSLDERYRSTKEVLEDIAEIERIDGSLRVQGDPPPTPVDDGDDEIYELLDDDVVELDGDDEATAGRKGRPKAAVIAAVAVVVLVVGGVVVGTALGPDEEQPVVIGGDESAQADSARDDSARADSARDAPSEAQAAEPPAQEEQAPAVITLIRTRPEGASIWLADTLVGMAPVQFKSSDHTFPLTVRAKLGEQSVERTLDQPGGEIWLELPDLPEKPSEAQARKDDPAASKGAVRDSKPSPSETKPARKKSTAKGAGTSRAEDSARKATSKPDTEAKETTSQETGDDDSSDGTRKYLPLE